MPEFDTIIKDGMVIDGQRTPRYRADIGIKDGRIAKIGHLRSSGAGSVLDASGMIVAPGFIDIHTHYDAQVFWDPYCTISGWHGVTTAVIGNCGFGFAPVRPEDRERSMLTMTRLEAIPYASMKAGMPWDWVTFPEFLDSLDRHPKALNLLPYVPVSPMMIWTMGLEEAKARHPTDREHQQLQQLLDQAMDAGACGWSAQRVPASNVQRDYDGTPMVSDLMADETCLALAQVLRKRNDGFMQITLVTGDPEHDKRHLEELARVSGRPIIYNIIIVLDKFPENHRAQLRWLEECRMQGLRVYGQGFTIQFGWSFTLADWNLFDEHPEWCDATHGSREERLAKLADPARREVLRRKTPRVTIPDFKGIYVVETRRDELKKYEALTLGEIAQTEGKHPVDVMLDIAVADNLFTEFKAPNYTNRMDLMKEVLDYRWVLPGISDGGAHTKFSTSGRYTTEYITNFVRDNGLQDLEEAHWRLSALPALCTGVRDRGMLREGAPADVVVYDYDNLTVLPPERATDLPGGEWRLVQKSRGYRFVLVNGQVTIEEDQPTATMSGRLLRHGL